MAKGNEVIVRTFTCEHCSIIYHAFHRSELEAHEALSGKEQKAKEAEWLENHIKKCYNKALHAAKKVANAGK